MIRNRNLVQSIKEKSNLISFLWKSPTYRRRILFCIAKPFYAFTPTITSHRLYVKTIKIDIQFCIISGIRQAGSSKRKIEGWDFISAFRSSQDWRKSYCKGKTSRYTIHKNLICNWITSYVMENKFDDTLKGGQLYGLWELKWSGSDDNFVFQFHEDFMFCGALNNVMSWFGCFVRILCLQHYGVFINWAYIGGPRL